jgi:hypothetical protein
MTPAECKRLAALWDDDAAMLAQRARCDQDGHRWQDVRAAEVIVIGTSPALGNVRLPRRWCRRCGHVEMWCQ